PARVFLRALDELGVGLRAGEQFGWERARPAAPSPARLTEMAAQAGDLLDQPLEELAPLLERFHDGEADPAEMAWVRALLGEREDAAEYLAELDRLSGGLQAASDELLDEVDFGGFWENIHAEINRQTGPKEPQTPAFDPHEHLLLLHRYADGEVDPDEQALVQAWVDQEHAEVKAYLAALDELRFGVQVAAETA